MAYSSYGKKVYSSIKDLPQYTSIGNGDKIIVWNETRDGAAVVDFADLVIDLEHCSFKSTISEMITLASDIQVFVNTVSDEITNIQDTLKNVEDAINNELRCRIKALEFIIAVMLGSNSYWLSDGGLDLLKNQFFISGIKPADNADLSTAESDEQKNTIKWFTGLINTIQKYIAKVDDGVQESHILLQSKYRYKYNDVMVPVTAAAPTTLSRTTTITTENFDKNDNITSSSTTTITNA
jgi:hypothetical protein